MNQPTTYPPPQAPVKMAEVPAQPKPMEVACTSHLREHLRQHKSFKAMLSSTKYKCKIGMKRLMKTKS
jgi:hypothetical protein